MAAGLSREDAQKTVDGDKKKYNFEKMSAVAAGALGALGTVKAATQTGFENRFDMAHELRTSGLMDGINGMNEGFIGIAKTVSETRLKSIPTKIPHTIAIQEFVLSIKA